MYCYHRDGWAAFDADEANTFRVVYSDGKATVALYGIESANEALDVAQRTDDDAFIQTRSNGVWVTYRGKR